MLSSCRPAWPAARRAASGPLFLGTAVPGGGRPGRAYWTDEPAHRAGRGAAGLAGPSRPGRRRPAGPGPPPGAWPAPGGTGINVQIESTDTAQSVNTETQAAINKYAFGVPNIQGFFLRGVDPDSSVDQSLRFSYSDGTFTGTAGTFEYDDNLEHQHHVGSDTGNSGSDTAILITNTATGVGATPTTYELGLYETRPKNFSVNYLVKY